MGILPFTAATPGKSGSTRMRPHVLIVEDNFLLSECLVDIVQEDLSAEPLTATCVSVALGIIPDDIVLAFLDIEVEDGKSYPAARKLMANNIPFICIRQ